MLCPSMCQVPCHPCPVAFKRAVCGAFHSGSCELDAHRSPRLSRPRRGTAAGSVVSPARRPQRRAPTAGAVQPPLLVHCATVASSTCASMAVRKASTAGAGSRGSRVRRISPLRRNRTESGRGWRNRGSRPVWHEIGSGPRQGCRCAAWRRALLMALGAVLFEVTGAPMQQVIITGATPTAVAAAMFALKNNTYTACAR